jgi:small redox-active disulfide protein 2
MKIVVYGPGCARRHETERVVRHVLAQVNVSADVEKVSDYQAMAEAGVVATPAVSIDGVLKITGRIPKAEEVKGWILGV